MMCSSALWGKISDQFGRRKALTLSTFYLFFYGVLSALAPNYTWMAFLRFLVGFSIGCVPQVSDILMLFMVGIKIVNFMVKMIGFRSLRICTGENPKMINFRRKRSNPMRMQYFL